MDGRTTMGDAGSTPRLARQDPRTGVRGQAARRVHAAVRGVRHIGGRLLQGKLSNLCEKPRDVLYRGARYLWHVSVPTAALPRRSARRPLGRESSPAARPSRANSVAWEPRSCSRQSLSTGPYLLLPIGDLAFKTKKSSIRQFQRRSGAVRDPFRNFLARLIW